MQKSSNSVMLLRRTGKNQELNQERKFGLACMSSVVAMAISIYLERQLTHKNL